MNADKVLLGIVFVVLGYLYTIAYVKMNNHEARILQNQLDIVELQTLVKEK